MAMPAQGEPLQITRIRSASEATPYLDDWRELAAGMPMRSPEWLLGWWGCFAESNDQLCVLLLRDGRRAPVGLAPLYLQGATGSRAVRILGVADHCTHHPDWLAAAGWEQRVGLGVAQFLLDHRLEWKRLLFEAIDDEAIALQATIDGLVEKDCLLHRRPVNSTWKIALPKTWDAYLATLSRSLRKRCRKLQRDYLDSGEVRIRQVENEDDLREGFAVLLQLHAARWGRGRNPLGVFSDQRFLKFHEDLSRELLARKQLRLAWLESDGRPLAIEYQFFDGDSVYAYLAGIDLERDEFSSGKLTMMAAIRFAIENGCRYFDLLGGDNPYKANWRATSTPCHNLRVWQKSGPGAIEWGMWHGYTRAVRYLKPLLPERWVKTALEIIRSARSVFAAKGLRGR